MAAAPMLNDANLEALCNVLGDTGTGLTGSEIARFSCNHWKTRAAVRPPLNPPPAALVSPPAQAPPDPPA